MKNTWILALRPRPIVVLPLLAIAAAAIIAFAFSPPSAEVPIAPAAPRLNWFVDVTRPAGVGDYIGQTYGASWGDFNGDGRPDLWASGHSPQRLYVNRGDGTFSDVAADVVSPIRYSDRHNAAWADFDNDGDDDLVQLSGAGRGESEDPNALYVNVDAHLTDHAEVLGLTYSLARSRAPLWVDVDNDARPDLIMTTAEREEAPPALFRWTDAGKYIGEPLGFLKASEFAQLSRLTPGSAVHVITGAPHTLFVHELRDGNLVSVGEALGLAELPGHWVSDLLIADLDNDLALDLVYVRGTAAPDVSERTRSALDVRLQSYRGTPQRISFQGPSKISVQPYPRGRHWWLNGKLFIGAKGEHPSSMPVDLSADDVSAQGIASGDAGLFLGFEGATNRWLIEARAPVWDSVNLEVEGDRPITGLESVGFSPHLRRLSQYIQWNAPGGFEAPEPNTLPEDNCLAGAAADFDNDMDLDLYLVCTDYLTNKSNLLLENLGERRFRIVPNAGGATGVATGIGESVSIADFDGDGSVDLFVRNGYELPPFGKGPDQLFKGLSTANHWMEIDLDGIQSNRNGIGARVILSAGGVEQVRIVDNGIHGRVQDFRRIHFGLGPNTTADWVRVEWPSGQLTEHREVAADRVWRIRESGEMR